MSIPHIKVCLKVYSLNKLLLKITDALSIAALSKYERTITTNGKDKMQTFMPLAQVGRNGNECRKFD